MSPHISVIIPVYNGEADLPDLIECLRSQTPISKSAEYIIVDNNSNDRTFATLQTAAQDETIVLCPLQEKDVQSSYAARNTGIQAARGDLLVFTDADCRPQPDWLTRLVEPFTTDRVGLVVGEIRALTPKTLLEKYAEKGDTLSQKHTLNHSFCPYGQTANLAIRRSVLSQVGLFRPYLTTGGDADLCWRILQQTDWELVFAPEAIVLHRHRSNLRQFYAQWRRYGESNRYLHQLHGVALMPEMTPRDYLYRLARWLAKELPQQAIASLSGRISKVDWLNTPIDLFANRARAIGQRECQLPDEAKLIPPFSDVNRF
jgi:cellulose synthase/poly-beta-1,6-N-acetylglucosamine synthase-like glycosyltransferase